jgi:hypothetical protein
VSKHRKWLQVVIGAVLITVAIVSMVNDWSFARYVRATEARDAAQEQCAREVVELIVAWAQVRAESEKVFAHAADVSKRMQQVQRAGEPVPPQLWDEAVDANNAAIGQHGRLAAVFSAHTTPACPH